MRPLLKESFMFKVSKNAKISFFVKSKNLAVVRVTNELSLAKIWLFPVRFIVVFNKWNGGSR